MKNGDEPVFAFHGIFTSDFDNQARCRMSVFFPPFRVENRTPLEEAIVLEEMYRILISGGFKVLTIIDESGQLFHPNVFPPLYHGFGFNVDLPEGWLLVDGYNEYGLKDSKYRQLLDSAGNLRGCIVTSRLPGFDDEETIEVTDGRLYCRYVLDPPNGEVHRKGGIIDTVYDRTAVNRTKPSVFTKIVRQESRPASKKPFGPPSQKMLERFKRDGEAEIEQIIPGKPRDDLPICRWLNEHYPNWQDPFAYWDDE